MYSNTVPCCYYYEWKTQIVWNGQPPGWVNYVSILTAFANRYGIYNGIVFWHPVVALAIYSANKSKNATLHFLEEGYLCIPIPYPVVIITNGKRKSFAMNHPDGDNSPHGCRYNYLIINSLPAELPPPATVATRSWIIFIYKKNS